MTARNIIQAHHGGTAYRPSAMRAAKPSALRAPVKAPVAPDGRFTPPVAGCGTGVAMQLNAPPG
jgi:hypothetical protein